MPLLAAVVTALYAFVNAFGAWIVIRRKPWVAGLFMIAAAVLMIAAAALVSAIPYTRVILAIGLVMAFGGLAAQRTGGDWQGRGEKSPHPRRGCHRHLSVSERRGKLAATQLDPLIKTVLGFAKLSRFLHN